MTPEDKQRDMAAERAEKILSFVDDWFNLTIPERKQMLAAEIRAAVAQETVRAHQEALRDYKADGLDIAYKQGLLDAAKIAQDESLRYAGKALLASDALADVSKAIRARAKAVADGAPGEVRE